MFYSQFVLAKKGPLGTIWIAAHLERKLRKNQVADTDIGVSVDSILSPDVPIALRLSSHLLLGVVKIYSRKVNYLFHDCSETLLKIKQAFRSTAVDLPPEETTAPYHSITLPETFDLDDFELPDSDLFQGNFVDHHISTREQITLQDSMDAMLYSMTHFGPDERFGDGDSSQIGLDLDENLLMNEFSLPGHDPSLPSQEAHEGTQVSSQAHAKIHLTDMGANEFEGREYPTNSLHYHSIKFPDLCEPFYSEHVRNLSSSSNVMTGANMVIQSQACEPVDSAQAPSTPCLLEEALPTYFHKTNEISCVQTEDFEPEKGVPNAPQTCNSIPIVGHLPFTGKHAEPCLPSVVGIPHSSPASICIETTHISQIPECAAGALEASHENCRDHGLKEVQASHEGLCKEMLCSVDHWQSTKLRTPQIVFLDDNGPPQHDTILISGSPAERPTGAIEVTQTIKDNVPAHILKSCSLSPLHLEEESSAFTAPPVKKLDVPTLPMVHVFEADCPADLRVTLFDAHAKLTKGDLNGTKRGDTLLDAKAKLTKGDSNSSKSDVSGSDIQSHVLQSRENPSHPISILHSPVQTSEMPYIHEDITADVSVELSEAEMFFPSKINGCTNTQSALSKDIQIQNSWKVSAFPTLAAQISDAPAETSKTCHIHVKCVSADAMSKSFQAPKAFSSQMDTYPCKPSPSNTTQSQNLLLCGHSCIPRSETLVAGSPVPILEMHHIDEQGWPDDATATNSKVPKHLVSQMSACPNGPDVIPKGILLHNLNCVNDADHPVQPVPIRHAEQSETCHTHEKSWSDDVIDAVTQGEKSYISDVGRYAVKMNVLQNDIKQKNVIHCNTSDIPLLDRLIFSPHGKTAEATLGQICPDVATETKYGTQDTHPSKVVDSVDMSHIPARDVQAHLMNPDCSVPGSVTLVPSVKTFVALNTSEENFQDETTGTKLKLCSPSSFEMEAYLGKQDSGSVSVPLQNPNNYSINLSTPETSFLALPAQASETQHLSQQSSVDAENSLFLTQKSISSEMGTRFDKRDALLKDILPQSLKHGRFSDFQAPEVLVSAPHSVPELLNNSGQSGECRRNLIAEEADVSKFQTHSTRKRKVLEKTPDIQGENIQNSLEISRSKQPRMFASEDDDELASILGCRRTPRLKVMPTPPMKEAIWKRARVPTKNSASKRKVLMDDTAVMHGDSIRQQLTNTEDIRRIRRKAPCTCHEIWMIEQFFLGGEMFEKSLFSSMQCEYINLSNQMHRMTEDPNVSSCTPITHPDSMDTVSTYLTTEGESQSQECYKLALHSENKSNELDNSSTDCYVQAQTDLQIVGSSDITTENRRLSELSAVRTEQQQSTCASTSKISTFLENNSSSVFLNQISGFQTSSRLQEQENGMLGASLSNGIRDVEQENLLMQVEGEDGITVQGGKLAKEDGRSAGAAALSSVTSSEDITKTAERVGGNIAVSEADSLSLMQSTKPMLTEKADLCSGPVVEGKVELGISNNKTAAATDGENCCTEIACLTSMKAGVQNIALNGSSRVEDIIDEHMQVSSHNSGEFVNGNLLSKRDRTGLAVGLENSPEARMQDDAGDSRMSVENITKQVIPGVESARISDLRAQMQVAGGNSYHHHGSPAACDSCACVETTMSKTKKAADSGPMMQDITHEQLHAAPSNFIKVETINPSGGSGLHSVQQCVMSTTKTGATDSDEHAKNIFLDRGETSSDQIGVEHAMDTHMQAATEQIAYSGACMEDFFLNKREASGFHHGRKCVAHAQNQDAAEDIGQQMGNEGPNVEEISGIQTALGSASESTLQTALQNSDHLENVFPEKTQQLDAAENIVQHTGNQGPNTGEISGIQTGLGSSRESKMQTALHDSDHRENVFPKKTQNPGFLVRGQATQGTDSVGNTREIMDNVLPEEIQVFSFQEASEGAVVADNASAGYSNAGTENAHPHEAEASGSQDGCEVAVKVQMEVLAVNGYDNDKMIPLIQSQNPGIHAVLEGVMDAKMAVSDHSANVENIFLIQGRKSGQALSINSSNAITQAHAGDHGEGGEASNPNSGLPPGAEVVGPSDMQMRTAAESNVQYNDLELEENDTEFLKVDDDVEIVEIKGRNMEGMQDDHFFENSGWSSRTRAVARYLKFLFNSQVGCERAVTMDSLLAGKTRKEASRMFFETLVLKTRDYVHAEQERNFGNIKIAPRMKLAKFNF